MRNANILSFTLCVIILFSLNPDLLGQVSGRVIDASNNDGISYASVYVVGSSQGTMTNESGIYKLNLPPGKYKIRCEYLGYKSVDKEISLKDESISLDFQLSPRSINLKSIEVSADSEDPAYAIIRKAQENRKKYRSLNEPHACRMYLKGSYELDSLPRKIMGIPVTENDSSAEEQIKELKKIYLSETISTIFRSKDEVYENIHSSRVSGASDMFSFNRGVIVESSFYDNRIQFPIGTLINPIGNQAFTYYDYKLESAFYDQNGNVINEISVIPKNIYNAVFSGKIYIVEGSWNIYGLSLTTLGKTFEVDAFDSVRLVQQFTEVNKDGKPTWVKIKSNLEMYLNLFGMKASGGFYALYSDYEFGKTKPDTVSNKETVRFDASANKKDTTFWKENRAIDLTELEQEDYIEKDSLERVYNSPEYKNRMDSINNRFRIRNILSGYTYQKTIKDFSLTIGSPINSILFNPVQGFNLNMPMSLQYKDFNLGVEMSYGIDDNRFRPAVSFSYLFNRINYDKLSGGYENSLQPINVRQVPSIRNNSLMSLVFRKNILKLHQIERAYLSYKRDIFPGLIIKLGGSYNEFLRTFNSSDYSFWNKENEFTPNTLDMSSYRENGFIEDNFNNRRFVRNAELSIGLEYFIGMNFTRYPERIVKSGYTGPRVRLDYTQGIPVKSEMDPKYSHVEISASYTLPGFAIGNTTLYGSAQALLMAERLSKYNLLYPRDNGSYILSSSNYYRSYLGMQPYRYASDSYNGGFILTHDFNSFIFNKIPLLKKTGFSTVVRAGIFNQNNTRPYHEYSVGIDKIGWGLLRLFRFDVVWSYEGSDFLDHSYILGTKLSLNSNNGSRSVTISF